MAQTKRKRRKKHKGTQAGTVERPHHRAHRSSRPTSRAEVRQTARQRREERWDTPPTWRGALNRAAIAALIFGVLVVVLFKEPVQSGFALAAFMLLMYIPMSYYTDRLIYNRRQKQKAAGR
jgi:Flp pilus assembly protein TadB